jgi:hypothetical protein
MVERLIKRLMEVLFPVVRHFPGGPGSWLIERVMVGRGQRGTIAHLVGPVIVKPVFAGLKARDDQVARRPSVGARMLSGRVIATPDVAALGAAPQVKPPSISGEALDTAVTARRRACVDQ